jgi:hypothetical protein
MECLGLHNKPKAEVHPGHKLTGPKEEEEEEEEEGSVPVMLEVSIAGGGRPLTRSFSIYTCLIFGLRVMRYVLYKVLRYKIVSPRCPSAWNNSVATGRISVKFRIEYVH